MQNEKDLIDFETPLPTPAQSAADIAFGPIPEINVPVLKPSKPISRGIRLFQNSAKKAVISTKNEFNRLSKWLLSNIPEPISSAVNKRVKDLQKKVKGIYDRLTPKQIQIPRPIQQDTALKGYLKTFKIDGVGGIDPESFLSSSKQSVIELIKEQKLPIKIKLILTCKFEKNNPTTGKIDNENGHFQSRVEVITESTDIDEILGVMIGRIIELISVYQKKGSGWKFEVIKRLDININPFNHLSASSFIPLPTALSTKKAIINVKNEHDNECFKWAVTSAVFPRKNPQVLTETVRENAKTFDWTGIRFPVSLKQIDTFERQNNYAINVYGFEGEVYPLRISRKQSEETIDLLLLSNDEGSHYCWIKSMSRLLSSQVSGKQHAREFCRRCLNNFHNKEALDKHQEFCSNHEAVKTVMPEHGTILKFKHFNRSMRVPFVVYADFECFTEPVSGCMPASDCSSTTKYQSHKPSGFSFLIKCFDDSIFAPILVSQTAESPSSDIPQLFIERLEEEIVDLYRKFKFAKKMVMSPKDRLVYQNAQECHICGGGLGNDRVRDHCHLTGKFRGAAHSKCNLDYRVPKFFPVIFHNLSGYDSHLFIKNLGKTEGKIDCIPTNEEKYISFTKEIVVDSFIDKDGNTRQVKRDQRFIDSYKFMASSLESLVKNLPKESFKNLTACHENPEAIELVMRKGVFPYGWFDSFDKLSETELPPIVAFYSKLNGTHISEEDWSHAQKVWEAFDMCNMRDYHDLYLETDVLLLADVFENFRDV